MADKKVEALKIIEEGLKELESPKGSVAVGVQKLSRASNLLDENDIYVWAEIQLGNPKYVYCIGELLNKMLKEFEKTKIPIKIYDKIYSKDLEKLKEAGINIDFILTHTFCELKSREATGGIDNSIHILEEHLPYLKKHRNDSTLYLKDVQEHISYIKRTCHAYLTKLYDRLKFSGTISSSFDLLKDAVDNRLLDLDPEIAEQLMLAFKSVSSNNKEEWSHALATCRRLLESLADKLYPANDLTINKRTFKQGQFVNRLWQFMNDSIESDSNRDLAQTHVNFLGSWLEKTNKLTNKGVHDDVSQLEATKAVFHLYLMLADLLDYLDPSATKQSIKPQIATASLDELEALLNVRRDVAKAIVIARVKYNGLTLEQLKEVKGVGPKTLTMAQEVFEFN
ncbi:helix-hairpin-helix domain-containing protein [Acinetobacter pittii]|uniref:ComEA family DNA-binding protein n=1 Tax=Acinetobacter pittii TaxID=48296 RepID=UPI001EFC8C80|nr:helix-hairpin-helix domain-containing protein [Acinetobacter pittii]MCG9493624.1 helix-hairpin-helix domain-containing protein [Acinetobacter pittii]